MNGKKEYSVYVHLPFCKRKCNYCSFYIIPFKEEWSSQYLKALSLEWEIKSKKIPSFAKLVSVFLGGGTPSLLSPRTIAEILSLFDINDDMEITLEANPEDVSVDKFSILKSLGINRVSVGAQSFNNTLLKSLGRNHSPDTIFKAIHVLSELGINNISMDLIYEIPFQTLNHWQQTLFYVSQLPLTHISMYNLSLEPHSVFYKQKALLTPSLPSEEKGKLMLKTAINFLREHKFERYEISAFSKTSFQSLHNIGYWTNREFIGLGVSASSLWNNSRFKNISHFHKYCRSLYKNIIPLEYEETLEKKEKAKETLALGLRLVKGISLKKFGLTDLLPICLELKSKNLLLISNNDDVKLSRHGLLFHDSVAEMIMAFS